MQVNVKELTGVLHLRLVFMNVLVLQSFLAVSFQVSKFLPSVIIISSLQVVQAFQVILPKLFKYLDCIHSQLQVYKLLVPTMAEAVMVRSLDLMDSYYTLSVSSLH